MKYSDAFPSKWLSADDLEEDLVVTISYDNPIEWEEFRNPERQTSERKPILRFKAPKDTKPLILNKTNWKKIAEVLGSDDTDNWAGRQITLYVAQVEAFGEVTTGIRVRSSAPKQKKPASSYDREPEPPYEIEDDSIPF